MRPAGISAVIQKCGSKSSMHDITELSRKNFREHESRYVVNESQSEIYEVISQLVSNLYV
jgi:hypothetical protein